MKKKIPTLKTDEDAEAFVANADLTEYDLSGGTAAHFEFEKKGARINMRLPQSLLDAVKDCARRRNIPYQRFIREALERSVAAQSSDGPARFRLDQSESIKRAHNRLTTIIGEDKIEPLDSAIEVERLRQAWKPEKVRVLLLAESHVWTSGVELKSRVRISGQKDTGFVRFVYCLGYGESSFVFGDPKPDHNGGTWQYWQLFHDCIHGPCESDQIDILKRTSPNPDSRIHAKIDLLNQFRENGLWLVDASVTALYKSGQILVSWKKYNEALLSSWDEHVANVLRESNPEKILIIGRKVAGVLSEPILKSAVPTAKIEVVPQPQARFNRDTRMSVRLKCREFCRS